MMVIRRAVREWVIARCRRRRRRKKSHDDATSTLEPPVLFELFDPAHDKAQSEAGRADGQELCLFVLTDRNDLCAR